eukprot:bmy_12270T0
MASLSHILVLCVGLLAMVNADYQSLRIGGLIIAGILFILGILIILSEYPYPDSSRESAGVCPNPVQSPLRFQPRPYPSPWPRPYFLPRPRPRLRPCLCPSPIAVLGHAPSTPPSDPPPLRPAPSTPPSGPLRLYCRPSTPLFLPHPYPPAAPALASASSGSLCRVERNLSALLPTPPPTGRRCRCKFNQQQRTGEPDEEEGTFRSSIRREAVWICQSLRAESLGAPLAPAEGAPTLGERAGTSAVGGGGGGGGRDGGGLSGPPLATAPSTPGLPPSPPDNSPSRFQLLQPRLHRLGIQPPPAPAWHGDPDPGPHKG